MAETEKEPKEPKESKDLLGLDKVDDMLGLDKIKDIDLGIDKIDIGL